MKVDVDRMDINLWKWKCLGMKTKKYFTIWIMIVIIVMIFSGCHRTKGPATEGIVTINGEKITEAEIMLYVLQVKALFEQVGGPEIWDTEDFSGGKTAQQVANERTYENLLKFKILVGKASSLGVALDQVDIDQTTATAEKYYSKIPAELISKHKITKQIVIDTFLDFKLASEVETGIKDKYEPTKEQIDQKMLEDPDYSTYKNYSKKEILTVAEVKYIYTKTANSDENNTPVLLTEEEQKAALDKINEAYNQTLQGVDFDLLIEQYSENEQGEGNNEINIIKLKEYFETLSIGKISNVVKTSTGYYIFQIVDINEPSDEEIAAYEDQFKEWEDTLRENSITNLKNDAYSDIYNEWKKETPNEVINDTIWDELNVF